VGGGANKTEWGHKVSEEEGWSEVSQTQEPIKTGRLDVEMAMQGSSGGRGRKKKRVKERMRLGNRGENFGGGKNRGRLSPAGGSECPSENGRIR